MEDPETIWFLHRFPLAPQSKLPVWWLAFNEFHAVEFTEVDLESAVSALLDTVAQWTKPHPNSIKKTYEKIDNPRQIIEVGNCLAGAGCPVVLEQLNSEDIRLNPKTYA